MYFLLGAFAGVIFDDLMKAAGLRWVAWLTVAVCIVAIITIKTMHRRSR